MKLFIVFFSVVLCFQSATMLGQPTAFFTASDSNICPGAFITFTDKSIGSPITWEWTFSGGVPSTSLLQNPPPIKYSSKGTYDVSLKVTNSLGSDRYTHGNYITVGGLKANAGGDKIPWCKGSTTTIGDVATGGTQPYTYSWSPAYGMYDSAQLTKAQPVVSPNSSVTYYVTVTDSKGCKDIDSARLVVVPYPQLRVPDSGLTIVFPTIDCGSISYRDTTIEVINIGSDTDYVQCILNGRGFDASPTPPSYLQILPGSTGRFTVRFKPNGAGSYSDDAIIGAPPCGKVFTIHFQGTSTSNASITPSTARFDFGSLSCGDSKDSVITIRNTGATDLTLSPASVNGSAFTLLSPTSSVSLPQGGSVNYNLRYTSIAPGGDSATLSFSGSPCGVTFLAELTGQCQGGVPQHTQISVPDATLTVGTVNRVLLTIDPPPIRMTHYTIPFTYDPDVLFIQSEDLTGSRDLIGTACEKANVTVNAGGGTGTINIYDPSFLPSVSALVALKVEALNSATRVSVLTIDSARIQASPTAVIETRNGMISVQGCEQGGFARTALAQISQNNPNPFNRFSTIEYTMFSPAHVRITVYDQLGKPIKELLNADEQVGSHTIRIDGNDFLVGAYFYEMKVDSNRSVKMMYVMR